MRPDSARYYLQALIKRIEPACHEFEIAGSIRRESQDVGDAEIVCLPKRGEAQLSMFSPEVHESWTVSDLDTALEQAIRDEILIKDDAQKRWGDRWKRVVVWSAVTKSRLLFVDIFIADEDNFGNALAIRTGDRFFSQKLYTHVSKGGLLPDYLTAKDGYLWDGETKIRCRTEKAFFNLLGIPEVPAPTLRSVALAESLGLEQWRKQNK